MMDIVYGLVAALCLGASDFLARFATRRLGTYRTLLFIQCIGFLVFSLFLFLTKIWMHTHIDIVRDWQAWVWTVLAALLDTCGYFALYRALETGPVMIVSPVVSGYAAITVVLSVLSGERLTLRAFLGLLVVLLGVILAQIVFGQKASSIPSSSLRSLETESEAFIFQRVPVWMAWTLFACVGFGVVYWLLGFAITPVLGGILPGWLFRLIPFCFLAPFSVLNLQSPFFPRGSVWLLLIGVGILDTAAILLSFLGLEGGHVAIVSVLVSLYTLVTLLLAWIFLKERLHLTQCLGIALILMGIVLITL